MCFTHTFTPSHLPRLRNPKTLKKRSLFRRSYLFAHLHLFSYSSFSSLIFFLLLVSSLLVSSLLWFFPPLLSHVSMLSEIWLLNFLGLWFCIWYIKDDKFNFSWKCKAYLVFRRFCPYIWYYVFTWYKEQMYIHASHDRFFIYSNIKNVYVIRKS